MDHFSKERSAEQSNAKAEQSKEIKEMAKEDKFGWYERQLDKCVADILVKGSGGALLGATLSMLLFRRRTWPIFLFTSFGIGNGYQGCNDITYPTLENVRSTEVAAGNVTPIGQPEKTELNGDNVDE